MRSAERVRQWQEILRRAGIALDGRAVGVWQTDDVGRLELREKSGDDPAFSNGAPELQAAFAAYAPYLTNGLPRRSYWVASRLESGWCLAPVRRSTPQPPPDGVERRGRARLLLEWVGTSLGLVGTPDGTITAVQPDAQANEILAAAPVGISWIDRDGVILRASDAELAMLGYSAEDYVGKSIAHFHVNVAVAAEIVRRLRAGDPVRNMRTDLRHRYGSIRHVLISANPIAERSDGASALLVTRDITDVQRADQELARFKAMVENAGDAIVGKTLEGIVTHWNPAATNLFGYAAEEMIGRPISVIVPEDRRHEMPAIFASLSRGERIEHFETTRIKRDGTRIEVSISISPVFDVAGSVIGATAIKRDITARRQTEERMLRGALHDALTDLPNRVAFNEELERSLARASRDPNYRFGVLYLDCDGFKRVNDTLGHAAGDALLQQIAERLRAVVRPNDVVSRLGGDEFTILLDDIAGRADIENAAHRVLEAFARPFRLKGDEVLSAVSIGAELCEPGGLNRDEILQDADAAMYHAKQRGGGRFHFFDAAMRASEQDRDVLIADLRAALKRSEFRVHYQPIFELDTGNVHALEALLRWEHPTRGTVAPLDFLPLAERAGVIIPIEEWVLGEACRNAGQWRKRFSHNGGIPICVNLSRTWLESAGVAREVERVLAEAELGPRALVLEIAERSLTDRDESATHLLRPLLDLAVGLYVDDFGTGHSSMNLLSQYPLLGVKVDQTVVHRMGIRRTDLQIMKSIIDVARSLGLRVIAEGVDTPAQRERLIAIGCDYAQGTLFCPPMDGPQVEAFLEKNGSNGASSGVPA